MPKLKFRYAAKAGWILMPVLIMAAQENAVPD